MKAPLVMIKKLQIPTRMAYLISIGSTVCGTTGIVATAPVIKANKNEVSPDKLQNLMAGGKELPSLED